MPCPGLKLFSGPLHSLLSQQNAPPSPQARGLEKKLQTPPATNASSSLSMRTGRGAWALVLASSSRSRGVDLRRRVWWLSSRGRRSVQTGRGRRGVEEGKFSSAGQRAKFPSGKVWKSHGFKASRTRLIYSGRNKGGVGTVEKVERRARQTGKVTRRECTMSVNNAVGLLRVPGAAPRRQRVVTKAVTELAPHVSKVSANGVWLQVLSTCPTDAPVAVPARLNRSSQLVPELS